MFQRGNPRRRPPLYLGCIVAKHNGCWGADATEQFPGITLDVFVTYYDLDSYEVYVVVKHKGGLLDELMQERIASYINLHHVGHGAIEAQTSEEMIMRLRVIDTGGPHRMMTPVLTFGAVLTEIGFHMEDGKESIWGVYEDRKAFDSAIEMATMMFGKEALVQSESWISESAGLVEGPRLFSESVLCNKVKFEVLRAMIDSYLREGMVSVTDQEAWPSEFWHKTKKLIEELAKVTRDIVVTKKLIELVFRVLFPDIPPLDP